MLHIIASYRGVSREQWTVLNEVWWTMDKHNRLKINSTYQIVSIICLLRRGRGRLCSIQRTLKELGGKIILK